MKNIITTITILSIFSFSTFGQSIAVKKAIRNGKTSNYYYYAKMSSSSLLAPEKLEKWYKYNKRKYYLINYTTKEKWAAGKKRKLVSSFTFVKANELSDYKQFQIKKLKEQARGAQMQARREQKNLLFLAGAFVLAGNALSSAMKSIDNSSSTNNSIEIFEWSGKWEGDAHSGSRYFKAKGSSIISIGYNEETSITDDLSGGSYYQNKFEITFGINHNTGYFDGEDNIVVINYPKYIELGSASDVKNACEKIAKYYAKNIYNK